MPRWRLLSTVAWLAASGCTGQYLVRGTPPQPFDVVFVPGCPNLDDGALSRCQMARAVAATLLWERGIARHFITSGSAVHSPYVEADAIAAAMAALGVPAERIYVETSALHTDENMYYSLQIARRLGLRTVAVVSSLGHAAYACKMLGDWGQAQCGAFGLDLPSIAARHARAPGVLEAIRSQPVADWVPLRERERLVAARTGRRRPPSLLLYPYLGWLRVTGQGPWIPPPSSRPLVAVSWATRTQPAAAALADGKR